MRAAVVLAAVVSSAVAWPSLGRRADTISNAKTPPVTVKGNAFFAGNSRFYIRGVDYQPGGSSANSDPIADPTACKRDVPKFQELGINTIRVYSVDNSANHDVCMKMLADAGIYLALDVNTPFYSLNRLDEPSIKMSYNDVYLQSVFATIDAFAKYDNTLLFYSANEVLNAKNTSFAAPYVKAVTRDMRQYIKARGHRSIPVGYSAADVEENRFQMATYMNCGSDDIRSDFFAFNDYSWCSPSSFQISGWDKKVAQYKDYGLPLFLSEYGCNTNKRTFEETQALYSPNMTPVYSGGLVYEYSQEEANYGLVTINGNGGTVTERPDFQALQSAFKNSPSPSGDGGYKSQSAASQCPPVGENWVVSTTDLPAIPAPAVKFFSEGAGPGPGNKGNTGSQTAGTPTTGFANPSNPGPKGDGKKSAAAAARVPGVVASVVVVAAVSWFAL